MGNGSSRPRRGIHNSGPGTKFAANDPHKALFVSMDWCRIEKACRKIPRKCRSQYSNFYAQAAIEMPGWSVEILSKKKSQIYVRPPDGGAGFVIRKHKLACLHCPGVAKVMKDKALTHRALLAKHLPVCATTIAHPGGAEPSLPPRSSPPYVVKPTKGSQGKGVIMGLKNLEEVKQALKETWSGSKGNKHPCVIQEQVVGHDYRILLLDGNICDVALRVPAGVKGNGRSSTNELVHEHNRIRKRSNIPFVKKSAQLGPFTDIPAKDEWRVVQDKANVSLGAEAFRFPIRAMHKDNVKMCERIAAMYPRQRIIGIDFLGDLSQSYRTEFKGYIIELNSSPQIYSHCIRNSTVDFSVLHHILKCAAAVQEADQKSNAKWYRMKAKKRASAQRRKMDRAKARARARVTKSNRIRRRAAALRAPSPSPSVTSDSGSDSNSSDFDTTDADSSAADMSDSEILALQSQPVPVHRVGSRLSKQLPVHKQSNNNNNDNDDPEGKVAKPDALAERLWNSKKLATLSSWR